MSKLEKGELADVERAEASAAPRRVAPLEANAEPDHQEAASWDEAPEDKFSSSEAETLDYSGWAEEPIDLSEASSASHQKGPGYDDEDLDGYAAEPVPEVEMDQQESSSSRAPESLEAQGDLTYAGRDQRVAGRDQFNAEGDIITYSHESAEKPAFEPVSKDTLQRLQQVFVEPRGYKEPRALLGSSRVALVHGTDRSGKWTCAINLSQAIVDLYSKQLPLADGSRLRVIEYLRPFRSELSLIEAMRTDKVPDEAVIVLRDAFERNIRPEELEASPLETLSELLGNRRFLIVTGDLPHERLASLAVPKMSAQVGQLREVLEKHISYLITRGQLLLTAEQVEMVTAKATWARLEPFLSTPFHIDQFVSTLCEDRFGEYNKSTFLRILVRLARKLSTSGGQAARTWFNDLHPNEQLLAIMVYLFVGAERRWLETLHHRLVQQLRESDLDCYLDPRQFGLEDIRERIHATEHSGCLEFEDRAYEREARHQISNRQHLVREPLKTLCDLKPRFFWGDPWKRSALGIALGRLGVQDLKWLKPILGEVARDEDDLRAVVSGYALAEVLRQDTGLGHSFVKETVESWIRSKNYRQMWSAGAALWRIYRAALESEEHPTVRGLTASYLRLLELLGNRLNQFQSPTKDGAKEKRREVWVANSWCVVDAMKRIVLADLTQTVAVLCDWLDGKKGSGLTPLGRKVVRVLFAEFAIRRSKPTKVEQDSLLELIGPLLSNATAESTDVQTVFLTLRAWLRWPEVAERVRKELLELPLIFTVLQRHRLRSILASTWLEPDPKGAEAIARKLVKSSEIGQLVDFWCGGTLTEARYMAQVVVARCHALEGVLPCLPTMGSALAVVDSALLLDAKTEELEKSGNALWRLLTLLESRLDVRLLRLGETTSVDLLDASLSEIELQSRFVSHRLLMPGIESILATHTSAPVRPEAQTVFVLASRKPHDLEDLVELPTLDKTYYLGSLEEEERLAPNGWIPIDLQWPPSPQQLDDAERTLEGNWARALATAPPEQWAELLRDLEIEIEGPRDAPPQLASWAEEAARAPLGRPDEDPIWKSVVLALWFAAIDLQSCLDWISSWLSLDRNAETTAKRAIGVAASYALIRLFTEYPPTEDGLGRAPTELFEVLAEPLAHQGPDGVNAVLQLVTHWMVDPVWLGYLAGDVQEGQGRLERWAMEFLCDRSDLAEKLVDALSAHREDADADEGWAALLAVLDRLEARRRLEHPKSLPTLSDQQRYALLVIGSRSGDENIHWTLARSAATLYESLIVHNRDHLVPVLYRLGERRPFWVDATQSPDPQRLLPTANQLPALIGPTLQTMEIHQSRIATVLLITDTPPLDLDDWAESAWWSQLQLYGGSNPPSAARFSTLPEPTSLSHRVQGEELARWKVNRLGVYLYGEPTALPQRDQEN